MKTRQDYLSNKCSHREYYGQFISKGVKDMVKRRIGVKAVKDALKEDDNLNSIKLSIWDGTAESLRYFTEIHDKLKEAGDYLTLAGSVCILKEAARQLAEENPVE